MALLESHEVDWLQALEPEIAGWLQLSAGRLRSLAAVDREAITELRSLVDSYEERRAAAATACDAAEQAMIASASALTCAVVKFHCSRTGALASSDATSASPSTSSPASTHTSHAFSGGGPESLKPMKPLAVRSVQHGQGGLTVSIYTRSISQVFGLHVTPR